MEAAAPIVVLGKVTEVKVIGRPHRSQAEPRVWVQLKQIAVQIEETIKGRASDGSLWFYYFSFSEYSEADLGRGRYFPTVGERRVFFLKPYLNTYRSIGDVTIWSLPVRTGPRQRGFCSGKSPGCCIAEILLVPGPGTDVRWFIHDLGPFSTYAAGTFCSPSRVKELVTDLARSPNQDISVAGKDMLSIMDMCWPQLNPLARPGPSRER